ncbi:hypothetical protein [Spirosoma sp. KNUC1025]|uniref:hypothetical protein n=1 Tax=Spirosoma sp. KNUC1025 TaxID=2894082 RepID=UPI00386F202F|nr:hypothetical protein LN737_09600 [Spirosoma sp. KNUC1025]
MQQKNLPGESQSKKELEKTTPENVLTVESFAYWLAMYRSRVYQIYMPYERSKVNKLGLR